MIGPGLALGLGALVTAARFGIHLYEPHRLSAARGDRRDDPHHRAAATLAKHAAGLAVAAWLWTAWIGAGGLARPPAAHAWLGAALVAAGLALRLWAMRTLGEAFTFAVGVRAEHRLVTGGPYRLVRHPGYTGTLLVELGFVTFFGASVAGALHVAATLTFLVARMRHEEQVLAGAFGPAYRRFAAPRKRLLPYVY